MYYKRIIVFVYFINRIKILKKSNEKNYNLRMLNR